MADTTFFINKGPFTLEHIAQICSAKLADESKKSVEIYNIANMEKANDNEICFFYDRKAKEKAANIRAKACITTEDLAQYLPQGVIVLTAQNPKLAFLQLNLAMYAEKTPKAEIADSAQISESAKIGKDCFIGENAVIGENVVIGNNCRIEANSTIDHDCIIGNNCRIGANAYVSYCHMGNDCYIYSGARIGCDGFGFMFIEGRHIRIPQLGRVVIGNDVEIGANTCIDRGALDDTIIGDGTRIDNLTQIAHNDVIGKGCIIVAQAGIAGSVKFGDYVICGGQVGVADHLTIGSGAQIASQSGLMKNVDAGAVVMGSPAVPFKDFMRQVATIQKLTKK